MKRHELRLLLLWIMLLLNPVRLMAETPLHVVVSIKPLHSLVAGVMGETGTPTLLVSGHTSPHDFQLKPSQMQTLQQAHIVFYIDAALETFLPNVLGTLPNSVQHVAMMQNAKITLLPYRGKSMWEINNTPTQYNDRNHISEHSEHHTDHDPHIWLNPDNAKQMVTHIVDALSQLRPENAAIYRANAQAFRARITALDKEIAEKMVSIKDKPFIVFHDSYQYFEQHYGLRAIGSITLEPNESPSPKSLRDIRQKLNETHAHCVFREPYFSDKLVKTVMEGSDAVEATLDPEATGIAEGAELYFTLMSQLADGMVGCLD
jgi:zinc transport system substrate-binding protein